ncbi:MAG: hypothetical protein DRR16_27770 [Candidatus Parabeggiatoa sp. nov. 3]|nr:MAG: hypothetical protein DRR00_29325 [Gammaproteobacteria bacterium]RKZ61715.1 MAG: hypothetical protein DRQ99_20000 [Gammaproteobacteria bacterium]RKZ78396.1 MAG: hypothetical protein DRR16_27770 [Gammaproteobacteria bacterium]
MFIKDIDFQVSFSDFSEKHYKKRFQKKYTKEWAITEKAIIESLKRVYRLKDTDRLDCIKFCEPYGLFKFDFAVAGTQKSPKKSGNRIILFLDNEKENIDVLLIYHKDDLEKRRSETEAWKYLIKNNFPTIWKNIFNSHDNP